LKGSHSELLEEVQSNEMTVLKRHYGNPGMAETVKCMFKADGEYSGYDYTE
jgi:hypothetical protein